MTSTVGMCTRVGLVASSSGPTPALISARECASRKIIHGEPPSKKREEMMKYAKFGNSEIH
eukprot:5299906-Prymnesium_polylepis.1